MKIAIYSDTFLPQVNGVITTIKQTIKNLTAAGHEVFLFTLSSSSISELKDQLGHEVKIFLIPSFAFWGYQGERFSLPLGWTFRKIKQLRPDIIHLHTPFAAGWEAIIAAKLLHIPLVGTHHTFFDHYLQHIKLDFASIRKLTSQSTAFFYNRCDLLLCPSQALINQLKTHGLTIPTAVLDNPVDWHYFRPVDNRETKETFKHQFKIFSRAIIYMGRLSYEKSLPQVIRGFALVAKTHTDIHLVLVGDGPEKASLGQLVKELGLEDRVIFTGYLFKDDLVKILQASDIFISASKSENQPTSFLEAMSTGLPVIAANAAGTPEVIRDKENGFLFTPDQPEELAQKIIELLDHSEKLNQFAQASRRLAQKYSNETVTAKLLTYYQGLIK